MGNRNSLLHQRKPAKTVAIALVDNLLDYTIKITSNTKRFPKSMRYTITDRLINMAIKAGGDLRVASKIRKRNKKNYKRVIKCLDKALRHLTQFEALMNQAHRFCDPGNFEHWADVLTKTYDAVTTWYSYEVRADRERHNNELGIMKTDKNGFFILEPTCNIRRWDSYGNFVDRDKEA